MKAGPALLTMARGRHLHLSATEVDPFLEQAVEHRVLGLVRTAVEDGRIESEASTRLTSALAAEELRNQLRWQAVERSAREAVGALAAVGCQVMVMKGWWSMYALHDRPTDRVTSDIDLLLEPGWRHRRPELVRLFQSTAEPHHGSVGCDDLGLWSFTFQSIDVDLHRWPMTLPIPMTDHVEELIWDRHTEVGHARWGGARVPSLELALAQALVNYSKDRFMQLFQMDDVRRLVTNPDLDWDEFHHLSRLAGIERVANAALGAVCRSLDLEPLPGVRAPSPLLAPWTARRVVLSGRRAPFGPLHVQLLGSLTYGTWRNALLTLQQRATPSPAMLTPYLELNGLPTTGGYGRSLARLSTHRLIQTGGRLVGREGPHRSDRRPLERRLPAKPGHDAGPPVAIVETASPDLRAVTESLAWSVLVRLLLRATSLRRTLALLDRLARPTAGADVVSLPTEAHFGRAGACLGRQLARSQFLRRRGATSTVLIGVRPTGGGPLDAHAWLAELDGELGHDIIHRIER